MPLPTLLLFALPFAADRICTVVHDYERLQGTWVWTALGEDGRIGLLPLGWPAKFVFAGNEYVFPASLHEKESDSERGSYILNPLSQPKQIDFRIGFSTMRGIYEFNGSKLRMCFGVERPKTFSSKVDGQWIVYLRHQTIIDLVYEVLDACLPPELHWCDHRFTWSDGE
jgi:uncharacterized protein (TIGR03067 family)